MGTTTSTLEPSRYARIASLGRCIREHAYESFGASPRERGCHRLRLVPMTALTQTACRCPHVHICAWERTPNEAVSSLAFARHSEDVGRITDCDIGRCRYRPVTGHFLGRAT